MPQDQLVLTVRWVLQEELVRLHHQDRKDHKVLRDRQDLQVLMDHLV